MPTLAIFVLGMIFGAALWASFGERVLLPWAAHHWAARHRRLRRVR